MNHRVWLYETAELGQRVIARERHIDPHTIIRSRPINNTSVSKVSTRPSAVVWVNPYGIAETRKVKQNAANFVHIDGIEAQAACFGRRAKDVVL